MNTFILQLNEQFKDLNNCNHGFLGGLRETSKKEFILPCFIDINGFFWTIACHGTSSKIIGRKIGKEGFISSTNGLYGPGVYFSNQLRKNLQYAKSHNNNGAHILVCLVNLGNNPYFTDKIGSCPHGFTSIIALGGYANYGSQIHTEIVSLLEDDILPLYSFTINETSYVNNKGQFNPVLYTYSKKLGSRNVNFKDYQSTVGS